MGIGPDQRMQVHSPIFQRAQCSVIVIAYDFGGRRDAELVAPLHAA